MRTRILVCTGLLVTLAGCASTKRRRAAFEEAKQTITDVERALGQKLTSDDNIFCPSAPGPQPKEMPTAEKPVPADWSDASWKCLGMKVASPQCQYTYASNGKTGSDATAVLTAKCDPNGDGQPLVFTLKVKATPTGDLVRESLDQPPKP